MFWHPDEETRKKNMVSIIKIARELNLYKDNYNDSQPNIIEMNEDEQNSSNGIDQPPMFTGNKVDSFSPKRQLREYSLALLN